MLTKLCSRNGVSIAAGVSTDAPKTPKAADPTPCGNFCGPFCADGNFGMFYKEKIFEKFVFFS